MSYPVEPAQNGNRQSAPADDAPLVLIAQGDKVSKHDYRELLQKAGYRIVVATDNEAAPTSRTLHPAIIILQLVDPAVTGLGLVREIRTQADTRATPVITLLRFDDAHIREQIVRAGATAIFIEPVKPPMLLRQLRRLLARTFVGSDAVAGSQKVAAAQLPPEVSRA